jgi:hypothetical protein
MNYKFNGRHALAEVGVLPRSAQEHIREWLEINFVDELGCEIEELENGGFVFSDPEESLGADDDAFGVYHVTDQDNNLLFVVTLFDYLPQGTVFDVTTQKQVADIIEGDITDIVAGYEEKVKVVCGLLPVNFN